MCQRGTASQKKRQGLMTFCLVYIFVPSSSCVNNSLCLHHMDANKTQREKARWQLHKNVTGYIARGVMVIVVGNGHGDTSSNPGRD